MSVENTYDFLEEINVQIERHINSNFQQVWTSRERTGLDGRCGMIYISEDAIATDKHNDSRLQYYGGFEYVDKDFRKEMGDYVFYFRESSRVADHIDQFFDREEDAA